MPLIHLTTLSVANTNPRSVPTLAREILDNAPEINLVSIAVGDPCTDNDAQEQSMDMLWYSHKHGFVPDADYQLLSKDCGARYPSPLSRGRHTASSIVASGFRDFTLDKQSPVCTLRAVGTRVVAYSAYRIFLRPRPCSFRV